MNLRNIDLNLLVIFDAVVAERSVGGAARKIGLSQSAVSHALRRLRRTFNDDLIRRTPEGMEPTARSMALADAVRGALANIEVAINAEVTFDPCTSKRHFSLRVSDYLTDRFLSGVSARLRREAPGITLSIDHPSSLDVVDADADVRFLICRGARPVQGYRLDRLYQGRFAAVLRKGHPAAGEEMTLDLLTELPHLRVDPATIASTVVDDALARRALTRNIVLTLPCLSGVLSTVRQTDLCAILPEAWLALHSAPGEFVRTPLPLPEVAFTVDMFSRVSGERDPGLRWFLRLVRDEFERLKPLLPGAGQRAKSDANVNAAPSFA